MHEVTTAKHRDALSRAVNQTAEYRDKAAALSNVRDELQKELRFASSAKSNAEGKVAQLERERDDEKEKVSRAHKEII